MLSPNSMYVLPASFLRQVPASYPTASRMMAWLLGRRCYSAWDDAAATGTMLRHGGDAHCLRLSEVGSAFYLPAESASYMDGDMI